MDDFDRANEHLDAGRGEEAMRLFRKTAEETGRLDAMHSVAHTYLYGIAGIRQDYDQAFKWFTRAAENGCPQAMYHLGMCNANGYGTPVNHKLSADWYRRSAEHGDEDALFELGNCFENGLGVGKDLKKAKDCYSRAAKAGQEEAAKRLKTI